MSNHTPGPWAVEPLGGKYYGTHIKVGLSRVTVWHADGFPSARECDQDPCDNHYECARTYADARLIAAAPDMLNALRDILQQGRNSNDIDYSDAIAAIAKAEGKS